MADEHSVIAENLLGKIAVANAKLAYVRHKDFFANERSNRLANNGARPPQRPLWASTGTKNPTYPDTLYVDALIGPNTVNTVPPKTLEMFRDHGTAVLALESDFDKARSALDDLQILGISIDAFAQELEEQGVKAFANAFTLLLNSIEQRRLAAIKGARG